MSRLPPSPPSPSPGAGPGTEGPPGADVTVDTADPDRVGDVRRDGVGDVGPVLLAVAHGTSSRTGIAMLRALADRVRTLAPGLRVELAFVDHEPPSVVTALERLAGAGTPVAVVPLLLTAASHSKGDIAGAIRQARAAHPDADIRYGRPLGAHPLLLDALRDRLAATEGRSGADGGVGAAAGGPTAVVLAAAGAADPDANAEIARVARLLWERRGGGLPVEAAYASATTPTVAEAIDRLHRLGHDRVTVVPYFLAPGRFPAAVARDAGAAGAGVTEVLGDSEPIARLLLERYSEATGRQIRMNCDTCLYRAPWPGREERVGAPQRPHAHPSDA